MGNFAIGETEELTVLTIQNWQVGISSIQTSPALGRFYSAQFCKTDGNTLQVGDTGVLCLQNENGDNIALATQDGTTVITGEKVTVNDSNLIAVCEAEDVEGTDTVLTHANRASSGIYASLPLVHISIVENEDVLNLKVDYQPTEGSAGIISFKDANGGDYGVEDVGNLYMLEDW